MTMNTSTRLNRTELHFYYDLKNYKIIPDKVLSFDIYRNRTESRYPFFPINSIETLNVYTLRRDQKTNKTAITMTSCDSNIKVINYNFFNDENEQFLDA
jgi:hypothetical protein